MQNKRRTLMMTLAAAPLAAMAEPAQQAAQQAEPRPSPAPAASAPAELYGLIGKMRAKPGQRATLAAILLQATQSMPGCLSYIVANDPTDADGLWITEVWDSAASHKASLQLPAVKAAIATARPLIAGFAERFETQPLGGTGLPGR